MKKFAMFASIVLVAVLGIILFYFLGTPAPEVSLSPDAGLIAVRRELTLKLDAEGGYLKKLSVSAVQAEKTVNVLVKDYPPGNRQAPETFNLAKTGLKERAFTLQVSVSSSAPLCRLTPQPASWQKECYQTCDALIKGEYDWAHLAMNLWPERVDMEWIRTTSDRR